MESKELDHNFWNERYLNEDTPWDISGVSPAIQEYIDQLSNKDLRILIPGAGNSYEAEFLHERGLNNVHVVDISPIPLQNLKERLPKFLADHLICRDFFKLEGTYDLIIEQTFFCALHPSLRPDYVRKCHSLLSTSGKVAGLFFNIPLYTEHPPYGGNEAEYRTLFKDYFEIKTMETATNSIGPRLGNELFFIIQKKPIPDSYEREDYPG